MLDLLDGELASEDDLAETDILPEQHLFWRAIVALSTGMQFDWRHIGIEESHILNDEGVDSGVIEIPSELACRLDLGIGEKSVHGDVDAGTINMSQTDDITDVVDAIGGGMPSTETRGADIDGIGAMQDGGACALKILGWCKQFDDVARKHKTDYLSGEGKN